ncbi:MAG: hypothetical protein ACJ77M_12180 [Thermoleophilaceae bacterium]|jgi:hypothetical protein
MLAQRLTKRNLDRAPVAPPAPVPSQAGDSVTIRRSAPGDGDAIARLVRLEDRRGRAPRGPYVVAERGGEVLAALPLLGGAAIADPFRRSADLVEMLELRARQLTGR